MVKVYVFRWIIMSSCHLLDDERNKESRCPQSKMKKIMMNLKQKNNYLRNLLTPQY